MPTPKSTGDIVKNGDWVKVEYIGKLEDDTIFEDSRKTEPLEFVVGHGEVIKGFDKGVVGMTVGQEKTIKIKPEDAYGKPDPKLIKKVSKKELPQDDLEEGMLLGYTDDDGQEIPGVITEIKGDIVTVDLNHPLAGETLTFTIKILEKGLPPSDDDGPTVDEE